MEAREGGFGWRVGGRQQFKTLRILISILGTSRYGVAIEGCHQLAITTENLPQSSMIPLHLSSMEDSSMIFLCLTKLIWKRTSWQGDIMWAPVCRSLYDLVWMWSSRGCANHCGQTVFLETYLNSIKFRKSTQETFKTHFWHTLLEGLGKSVNGPFYDFSFLTIKSVLKILSTRKCLARPVHTSGLFHVQKGSHKHSCNPPQMSSTG